MNETKKKRVTKTTSVRARVTNDELERIRELAAKQNKTMSALIRECLLCQDEKEEEKKDVY
jgi:predicted DNA-binding protein